MGEEKFRTLSYEDWLAEGKALFGENFEDWEFVCPSCGHVQKVSDFRQFAKRGASPDTARFNCIGRYDGHLDNDAFVSGQQPCNYTSGGLICITPVSVILPDGKKRVSFEFNKAA